MKKLALIAALSVVGIAKVCLETVGRVTVKSLPAGVTMSQVLSVTKPLIVIVPSAA